MKKFDYVLIAVIVLSGFLVSRLLPRRLTTKIQVSMTTLSSQEGTGPNKNVNPETPPEALLPLKDQLLTKSPELELNSKNSSKLGIATLQSTSLDPEYLKKTLGNAYVEGRRIDFDLPELRDTFKQKSTFDFPLPSGKVVQMVAENRQVHKEGWESFNARLASDDPARALDLLNIDYYYGRFYGSLRVDGILYQIEKADPGLVILEVHPDVRID